MTSLAGTYPIPASSGNTVRHRLNRGGDRRLNRALTTIVIVRMRIDPATPSLSAWCETPRAYVARRRAEGRTTNEIMRSLKRYITCQLYRTLATADRYRRIPACPETSRGGEVRGYRSRCCW